MTHDTLCYRSHDQPLGRDPLCQCAALRSCAAEALAAAVQRVEALWALDPSWDGTNWNNALTSALAAIKESDD